LGGAGGWPGVEVGAALGAEVGAEVGDLVGAEVGAEVGARVMGATAVGAADDAGRPSAGGTKESS